MVDSAAPVVAETRWGVRRHLLALLALTAVVLLPRIVVAVRMATPSRDAFVFYEAAQTLKQTPFREAARTLPVHPLYPLLWMQCHEAYLQAGGGPGPMGWIWSAQALDVAAAALFFAFAYAGGCVLCGPRVSLLGCMVSSLLPLPLMFSADVLSDSVHAAFWMAGAACFFLGFARRSPIVVAMAAIPAGLAYWTRVEAIILPVSALGVLLLAQLVRSWRWSWGRWLIASTAYAAVFAVAIAAFVGATGRFSCRHASVALIGLGDSYIVPQTPKVEAPAASTSVSAKPEQLPAIGNVDVAPRPYAGMEGYKPASLPFALALLCKEWQLIGRGWPFLLILASLLTGAGTRALWPAPLLATFATIGLSAAMVVLQMRAGYMTCRYLMPLVPFLGMWAILGVDGVTDWLAGFRTWSADLATAWQRRLMQLAFASAALIALPTLAPRMNRPQANLREAGSWLVLHSVAGESVFDPSRFSSFYASRQRWTPAIERPVSSVPVRFAVIETAHVYRVTVEEHAAIRHVNSVGRLVAQFPAAPPTGKRPDVCIFELPASETQIAARNPRR